MIARVRIDRLLVARGLFESRAKAQGALAAGLVSVDAVTVVDPAEKVSTEAALRAEPAHAWVSRGAVKLVAALERLHADPLFNPAGRVCLDVGASTGGFTEVLLARGARMVYAVDVGRGQLHRRLRGHPGVVSLEATDIRKLDAALLTERPDFVTVDVSFISLELVLPPALMLIRPPACLLALIKPQFEAGRRAVKKGVVRDAAVHESVCRRIGEFVSSLGWEVIGIAPSPVAGGDNREFFLGARTRMSELRDRPSDKLDL
jgi:23S rRNA (cytidine1920-2'-O)/16S rRNA (cytidine1409-2'-O)-methyltransferase